MRYMLSPVATALLGVSILAAYAEYKTRQRQRASGGVTSGKTGPVMVAAPVIAAPTTISVADTSYVSKPTTVSVAAPSEASTSVMSRADTTNLAPDLCAAERAAAQAARRALESGTLRLTQTLSVPGYASLDAGKPIGSVYNWQRLSPEGRAQLLYRIAGVRYVADDRSEFGNAVHAEAGAQNAVVAGLVDAAARAQDVLTRCGG